MPFLDIRNDTMPLNLPGSAGPVTGMGENFEAAFRDQSRNNSLFGLEAQFEEDYLENQRRIQKLTGDAPKNYPLAVFTAAARQAETGDPTGPWQRPVGGSGFADAAQQRMWDEFSAAEQGISELKKQYPDIKTVDEIWKEVQGKARAIADSTEDIEHRSGILGAIGGFAGRMAGSFTWRDPVNIGTLGLGGAGRQVATRIATEVGAASAVEAIDQFTGVQPSRKLLGLKDQNPWESIAAAGVGAGVLRGAFEGAAPAYRALEAKINPNRAAARVIAEEIEGNLGKPMGSLISKSGLSDKEILDFLHKQPQTADVRGAIHALDEEMDTIAANPYGAGRDSEALHAERLEEAYRALDGRPSRSDLQGSSAMVRALETPDGVKLVIPEPTAKDLMADEIMRLSREDSPQVFRRVDEAHARIAELEKAIGDIESSLNARGVADTMDFFDADTANRVRAVEAELSETLPATTRQELERELDMMVESYPADALIRREQDYRIGPERQMRDLEASRKAAKRELRRAVKDAEAVGQRVVEQQRAARYIAEVVSRKPSAPVSRYSVETGFVPSPNETLRIPPTQEEAVAGAKSIAEVDAKRDDLGAAIVDKAKPIDTGGRTLGKVDIGLKELVPEDFHVPISDTQTMTVRQILDDLAEDERLVKQMKVCSI